MFTSNMRGGHKSHSPLPPEAPQLRCISKRNTVDDINYWRQQQDFLITTNKSRLHEGGGGSSAQRLRLIIYSSQLIIGTLHTWQSWQEYYLLQAQKHANSKGLSGECVATCLISCIWEGCFGMSSMSVWNTYTGQQLSPSLWGQWPTLSLRWMHRLCGIYKAVAYICTISFGKTGWKWCLSWKQWTRWTSNCIFTCRPEVGCIMFIELLVSGPTGAS